MPELPLRDIHLPDTVSWWPPAPGWWVLSIFALGAVMWLVYRVRRGPVPRPRQDAAAALQRISEQFHRHGDVHELLSGLSVLLRRIGITYLSRDRAGLTGVAWYQQLNTLVGKEVFTSRSIEILCQAPYRRDVTLDSAELTGLIEQSRQWITALPARLPRSSREVRTDV